jgi:hypothetical protein
MYVHAIGQVVSHQLLAVDSHVQSVIVLMGFVVDEVSLEPEF